MPEELESILRTGTFDVAVSMYYLLLHHFSVIINVKVLSTFTPKLSY